MRRLLVVGLFAVLAAGCNFDVVGLTEPDPQPDLSVLPDLGRPATRDLATADLRPVMGTLRGMRADAKDTTVDLTAGSRDWVHFGLTAKGDVNTKAGVSPLISLDTVIGTQKANRFTDNAVTFTWSDGSPVMSSDGTTAGVDVPGLMNGFSITSAADTTQRTLKVWVSGYKADVTMTAHLGDGSAADYTDTQPGTTDGSVYSVYTFTYRAASATRLFLQWTTTVDHGGGNVTLSAVVMQ